MECSTASRNGQNPRIWNPKTSVPRRVIVQMCGPMESRLRKKNKWCLTPKATDDQAIIQGCPAGCGDRLDGYIQLAKPNVTWVPCHHFHSSSSSCDKEENRKQPLSRSSCSILYVPRDRSLISIVKLLPPPPHLIPGRAVSSNPPMRDTN
jgi:hypothetical protein